MDHVCDRLSHPSQIRPRTSSFCRLQANLRIWNPLRAFIPTLTQWRYRQTLSKLNNYIETLVRKRWSERRQGRVQSRLDILDRVLEAVNPADWSEVCTRRHVKFRRKQSQH